MRRFSVPVRLLSAASLLLGVAVPALALGKSEEPKEREEHPAPASKGDSPKSDIPKKESSPKRERREGHAKKSTTKLERAAVSQEKATDANTLREKAAAFDTPSWQEAPVGPRQGAGQRNVSKVKAPEASEEAAPEAGAADAESTKKSAASKPAHQKGAAPRKPQPVLPPGSPLPAPDAGGRREIAGGATREDVRLGADDPELRALREADRVLFPKPLEGFEPGWSWEFERARSGESSRLAISGLPPDARVTAPPEPVAPASESAWLKTLALPNLPVRMDANVVKYLLFYRDNARGKTIARVWAKKSGRYIAAMKAEFAKAGLPTDLVWMSLIESGHSATIYSPVGAAGLWQFMPEAGRLYGLTVDRWVDERLDPQRSTEAAIRYLSDLHRRFGNWELAMAAYNMGYAGLSRAIRKFNTNDFWQLTRYEAGVPWETALYVPKIFATAILMSNKQAFGIADVVPEPAVRFDTVRVEPGLSLQDVARAAGVAAAKIEALNPHYRIARTPPSRPGEPVQSWLVRVPVGKGVAVSQRLAKSITDEQLEPYVVRFGDTATSIAARYRTTEEKLRQLNRIGKEEMLAPGTVLLAPQLPAGEPPGNAAGDEVVVVPPQPFQYSDRRRVFYRVLPGDTLSRVAQALAVTRAELLTWNALDTSARLQAGMVLQAFVARDAVLDDVRHLKDDQTRVLVAGSDEFFDYFEGLNGRKRIVVNVKEGETLQTVAKRHGISVGMMERINRRSRTDKLRAGDTLVVYTQRVPSGAQVADTDGLEARPLERVEAPRPEALPSVDPQPPPAADLLPEPPASPTSDQAGNTSHTSGG